MKISKRDWQKYITLLRKVNEAAADKVAKYMDKVDINTAEGMQALLDYSYAVATKYGEGATAVACQMYEEIAAASGKTAIIAEPAPTATYGEVVRAVKGKMFDTKDPRAVGSAVGRLVKMAGVDTTMKNAIRDGAEWAWIPSGDSCAFCLTLASQGWVKASKKVMKGNHADHIHPNCDCTFAIRFDDRMDVEGYDPEALYDEYAGAEGGTSAEKINALRRKHYAANKDKINAQKRAAYAKRKRDRLKSEPGILKKPESIKNDFGDVKLLKIQDDEREIMKSLYEKGKNNGYENGIIIYSDGVKRECCSSNPSGVRMTIDREEQKGIKLYHNHTNDSIPSKGDLEKLVDIRVDEVGVITDNREIYTVSIGYGQRPTIDEYNTVAKQISNEVRQDLMSYAGYDDWTIEERQYMFFRERTRRIAGYFEWELRGGAVDE